MAYKDLETWNPSIRKRLKAGTRETSGGRAHIHALIGI